MASYEYLSYLLTGLLLSFVFLRWLYRTLRDTMRSRRQEEMQRIVRLHLAGQPIAMRLSGEPMDKLNGVYRIGRVITYGAARWEGEVTAKSWHDITYEPYEHPMEEMTLSNQNDLYDGLHVKFLKYLKGTEAAAQSHLGAENDSNQ